MDEVGAILTPMADPPLRVSDMIFEQPLMTFLKQLKAPFIWQKTAAD